MTLTTQEQEQALRMTMNYIAWMPYLGMDVVTPETRNLILGACQYQVMPIYNQIAIQNMLSE